MRLLIALLLTFILYVLQTIFFKKHWFSNLSVTLKFDKPFVMEGEKAVLTEIVNNNKRLPLPLLHIKFKTAKTFVFDNEENSNVTDFYYRNDIFSITVNQKITRSLPFTATKRGYYEITTSDLIASDLFLTQNFAKIQENNTAIYVFPSLLPCEEFMLPYQTIMGEITAKRLLLDDPFAFRGIRNYQPFDSIRSINWKSTARTNELQVNLHEPTTSYEVRILLNLSTNTIFRQEDMQEYCIRVAGTLAYHFLQSHITVSLYSNGCDVVTKTPVLVSSGSDLNHNITLNQQLARIDLGQNCTDFLSVLDHAITYEKKQISYIIISNSRNDALINKFYQLQRKNISLFWVIPEPVKSQITLKHPNIMKWEVNTLA